MLFVSQGQDTVPDQNKPEEGEEDAENGFPGKASDERVDDTEYQRRGAQDQRQIGGTLFPEEGEHACDTLGDAGRDSPEEVQHIEIQAVPILPVLGMMLPVLFRFCIQQFAQVAFFSGIGQCPGFGEPHGPAVQPVTGWT